MLAHAKYIQTHLIGKLNLLDQVAQSLRGTDGLPGAWVRRRFAK
jgi:hypothetical protein